MSSDVNETELCQICKDKVKNRRLYCKINPFKLWIDFKIDIYKPYFMIFIFSTYFNACKCSIKIVSFLFYLFQPLNTFSPAPSIVGLPTHTLAGYQHVGVIQSWLDLMIYCKLCTV